MEKVTIYITTHNRADKVKNAINSALSQTYSNIEVILSDDGSSDDTPRIANQYKNKFDNFIYVRNEQPKGANCARNNALRIASGNFITGLDDDDIFLPERIENFILSWKENYSLLCDNFIDDFKGQRKPHYSNGKAIVEIDIEKLLVKNLCTNQIFTRTKFLRDIGGFDESLKRLQDWECWIRLVNKYGDAARLNNCSYIMFHDQANRVSNAQRLLESYDIIVKKNINIFNNVLGSDYVRKFILREIKPQFKDYFKYYNRIPIKSEVKHFFGRKK
ncbi:glycosyltransferase [Vibrio fluvialis]|nr:glycosyltransferase [Vibrio fluvialis]MBY8077491.1 glycosyltransferase [Vibrio fluvialis]MBY8147893.1 glycosyltransferase [Vibrio fluvialis]